MSLRLISTIVTRGPFLMALSFLLASCAFSTRTEPRAIDGVIDLRQWNFSKNSQIELKGEWKFFWKEFVDPKKAFETPGDKRLVPLAWQASNLPGNPKGHSGWATYALKLLLPQNSPTLGLRLNYVSSAYELYADGKKLLASGLIGTSEASEKPSWIARVIELPRQGGELELVFHVSDFHERTSGLSNPLYVGGLMELVDNRQGKLVYEVFIFATILIMGLYHLALFLFHRKDFSNLFFSLLCFLLCWRDFIYEELLVVQLFPDIDWLFMIRLGYWDYVACTVVFFHFIRAHFAPGKWKILMYIITAGAVVYCVLVALTPVYFFADFLNLYHLFTLCILVFTVTVLAQAIGKGEKDAILFLFGFLFFFAAVVNDILRTAIYLQTVLLAPLGLFFFLLFQSLVMTRKFAHSIRTNERLAAHLSHLNTSFERFVPKEILSYLHRESIADVELGDNSERDMAVLFVDIRGFTSMSEKMSPKENFRFINSFLARVGPVIRKHEGFVDKYLGDGVMALFPKGADHAVMAALDIQEAIVVYNSDRAKSHYEPVQVAIGIHAGPLMLGTIGENLRMDSTVISDTVNLASRMEGVAKKLGLDIVATEATYRQLSDPRRISAFFVGEEEVKGKSEKVRVWHIHAPGEASPHFSQGKSG